MRILFRMMASNIPEAKIGGNICLDIGVILNIELAEDEDDVEALPKELLDLIDRFERRSQPNIN